MEKCFVDFESLNNHPYFKDIPPQEFKKQMPLILEAFERIHKLLDYNNCDNPDCAYKIVEKDYDLDLSLKPHILSYLKSLQKIPVPIYDFLNIDNVGIQNGKLIFFDIT